MKGEFALEEADPHSGHIGTSQGRRQGSPCWLPAVHKVRHAGHPDERQEQHRSLVVMGIMQLFCSEYEGSRAGRGTLAGRSWPHLHRYERRPSFAAQSCRARDRSQFG
eukprot:gene4751-biopygen17511